MAEEPKQRRARAKRAARNFERIGIRHAKTIRELVSAGEDLVPLLREARAVRRVDVIHRRKPEGGHEIIQEREYENLTPGLAADEIVHFCSVWMPLGIVTCAAICPLSKPGSTADISVLIGCAVDLCDFFDGQAPGGLVTVACTYLEVDF